MLTGKGITIAAVTPASKSNEFITWAASAGGGKGDVGIAGSVAVHIVTFDTEASARSASALISNGGITVQAISNNEMQTLAAAGAFSQGTAIGLAVAVGVLNTSSTAYIGGDADASGAILVDAQLLVSPSKIDLPFLDDSQDPTITSVALAGAASNGDAAIGASVVVNDFHLDAAAYVGDGSKINQGGKFAAGAGQNLTVTSLNDTDIISIAGALALTTGSAGVGAGVDVEIISKTTRAYIGRGAIVSVGGATKIGAVENMTMLSVAAVAAVADSAAVAATASIQVVTTDTKAYLADVPAGTATKLTSAGSVTISADTEFKVTMIAGSVGVAGSAGIGAANATLVHDGTTSAYVGQRAIASAGGIGLKIDAQSHEDILSIAAGIAIGGSVGVAGSAAVGVLEEKTSAYVGRGANITVTNGDLDIDASDVTEIISVAGSIAGGSVGVGIGADAGVFTKTTRAYIDSGVTANVDDNIFVTANSTEDLISVSAGLGAGGVAVAVNAGVHVFNITTKAFIGDDPDDPALSAGAGNVFANGSIVIYANDYANINEVVGVLAAGGVGVGAAAGVNVLNKDVKSFVGAGAVVRADGNRTGVTVQTGRITPGIDALGATYDPSAPGTPGIESNKGGTLSAATSGNRSALRAQGKVGTPSLGGMDLDGDGGKSKINDPSLNGPRSTTLATQGGFKGLSVSATNRDEIRTFTISLSAGGVAVAVSAGIDVVNAKTTAYIGDNAKINTSTAGANGLQSVLVAAGDDFYHLTVSAGLAVGGVGIAPAVGVNVVTNETKAWIGQGANVKALNDITVEATGKEDLVMVGLGIAAGAVGVGGVVNVLDLDITTQATINGLATVLAGGDVFVSAEDDTHVFELSGALGVGFVGVGASVGVMIIDKTTLAAIGNSATVEGLGGGAASVANLVNGNITGNAAERTTAHGVIVQADSSENIVHISAAGGGGFVGVAGSVGVTLVRSDTSATIGSNAIINRTSPPASANALQMVYVNATNDVNIKTFVIGVAGGFVGVAGAVDVGTLNNNVKAEIQSGSKVSAKNSVYVNAVGLKDLVGFDASGAGGVVGVGGAVSVWSIGTKINSNYQDNEGHSKDSTAMGKGSGDEDAADQASKGTGLVTGDLGGSFTGKGGNKNTSQNRVDSISGGAITTVNTQAPNKASILGLAHNAPVPPGTSAVIQAGADIDAGQDIGVRGNAASHYTVSLGSVAVGLVGIGASVVVMNIADNVTASADGVLAAGDDISVLATLNDEVDLLVISGSAGFVGLGAAVGIVNDSSLVQASLGSVETADAVSVTAVNTRDFDLKTDQVSGGAVAAGVVFTRLDVSGGSIARVNANAVIGGPGSVNSLTVSAAENTKAVTSVLAVTAGVGAFGANFSFINVHPDVKASIGAGAKIDVNNAVKVSSVATIDAFAEAHGVAAGGLAVGASLTDVTIDPTVIASVGNPDNSAQGVNKLEAGSLTVTASTVLPASGFTARSRSIGSAGALIGVTSTNAVIDNTSTVKGFVGDGAILTIAGATLLSAVNNTRQKSTANSNAGGLIAAGIAYSETDSNTVTQAFLGKNVTFTGQQLTIGATGKDDNFAFTNAGSGGLIAGALSVAHAKNISSTLASIGAGSKVNLTTGAGALYVGADQTAQFNSQITTVAGGLFAGAGGESRNTATANTTAAIGDNVVINAKDIEITATTHLDKPIIGGSPSENIKGTTGGLVSGAGADDKTTISTTTKVTIGNTAKLTVVGLALNTHTFKLASLNDFDVHDAAAFITGGALSGAFVDGRIIVPTAISAVQIGTGAILTSDNAIDISARGKGTLQQLVSTETYGLGTATVGSATVDIRPDNQVVIGANSKIKAYGDLNLSAGSDTKYNEDVYHIEARFDGFAGALVPISDIGATGYLIQSNKITVANGALLQTARAANLFTARNSDNVMDIQAKAVSWVSELQSALLKAQGGGALLEYQDANVLSISRGVIQMDGTVETGIIRQQSLWLKGWDGKTGTITSADATDGVTFEVTQESLTSGLVAKLAEYQDLLNTYGPSNPTLKQYYEEEIARVEAELDSLGIVTKESDGKGGFVNVVHQQYVMTVTVNPIWADSGSITTRGDSLQGTGTWIAPNDASVTILNDTPAFLKIKGVTIPYNLGGLFFNGDSMGKNSDINKSNALNVKDDNLFILDSGSPIASFFPGIAVFNLGGVATGATEPSVVIQNRLDVVSVNNDVKYKINGKFSDYPWPDLTIMSIGDGGIGIHNLAGKVELATVVPGFNPSGKGNVNIFGPVESKSLNVVAGGELFISVPVFEQSVPLTQWKAATGGWITPATAASAKGVLDQQPGAAQTIMSDKIHIKADFINLNGIIQSGKADYGLTFGVATAQRINDIILSGATGKIKLVQDSTPDFTVFFNTATKRIEVDDLRTTGGNVDITGRVMNTGNGQINVFGGYGHVSITNNTAFDLGIHRIDMTEPGAGKLLIHDITRDSGGKAWVKLYQQTGTGLQITTDDGINPAVVQNSASLDTTFAPVSDWRYAWTVASTQEIRKTKHLVESSWLGIINLGDTISEWDATEIQGQPTLITPAGGYYRDPTGVTYDYASHTTTLSNVRLPPSAAITNTTWYGETSITVDIVEISGTRTLHDHNIAANRDIGIHFFGYDEGGVTINSTSSGRVYIQEQILNPHGTTSITSQRSILSDSVDSSVGGNRVILSAQTGIGTTFAPLRVDVGGTAFASLSAKTASGNITIQQTVGTLEIDQVVAQSLGDVTLSAPGSIMTAQKSAAIWYEGLVSGGTLKLTSLAGGIGNDTIHPLVLDTPLPPGVKADINDTLTASAQSDVFLKVKSGDLRVKSITTSGDVWVNVTNGSLIDSNNVQVRDERTYAQLKAGVWSSLQLTGGTGYQDKVDTTVVSFISSKGQDYNTYWQFRKMQADGGAAFDAAFQVGLSVRETDYYVNVLGYDASALVALVTSRTASYHALNAIYGVGGTYTASNDPAFTANTFNGNFAYKAAVSELNTLKGTIKQWTEDQLLYAISAGLMKDVTSTVVNIEQPNIVANNVTIITKANVGQKGTETLIDLTPANPVFTDDERVALAAAERLDVQFLGGAVVTATVNFDAASRTITRTTPGSWISNGFVAGMYVTIQGANGQTTQNETTGTTTFHRIQSVTATVITLDNSTTLTSEGGKSIKIAPVVLDPTFQASAPPVNATVQFTGATLFSAGTVVRVDGGNWITDGFAANQLLQISGSVENSTTNGQTYRIASVTSTVITLNPTASIVTENANQVVTLRRGTAPTITAIRISNLDDVNVNASGGIDIIAGKGVLLGSTIDIKLEQVIAGNAVTGDKIRIKGSQKIVDAAAPGLAYIRGNDVILEAAQGGIGTPAAPITLDSLGGGTLTARALGAIYITGVATVGPGNLNIESVFSATGNAVLAATGSILDAFNNDFVKVKAARIFLTTTNGTIGALGNYLDVDAADRITANAGGSIWISETNGDFRIDRILSNKGDVDLRAQVSIVDAQTTTWDKSGLPSLPGADVIGNSIKLTATGGAIGDAINAVDINSQFSAAGGTLTSSSALADTYIIETVGDLRLNAVIATGVAQSAFLTARAGSILNGAGLGKANVVAANTRLLASKDIGEPGNRVQTKVANLETQSTAGSTWVANDGVLSIGGTFTASLFGAYAAGSVNISAASPVTFNKRILAGTDVTVESVDDNKDGNNPAADDVPDDMIVREKDLFGQRLTIKAVGTIRLLAGDDLTVEKNALIEGGTAIHLFGDWGSGGGASGGNERNADPNRGTTIIVAGTLTAPFITINGNSDQDKIFVTTGKLTAVYPWATQAIFNSVFGELGKFSREPSNVSLIIINGEGEDDVISVWGDVLARDIFVNGQSGEDVIALNPENPDGYRLKIAGHVRINGGQGLDDITVNKLNTLDVADKYVLGGVGPGKLVTGALPSIRDTVDIDGGEQADHTTINTTGDTDYIINVTDTGFPYPGSDTLVINGTDKDDTFLLRDKFVALLQPQSGAGGFAETYERINYDETINVLQVNAYKGDDAFYVDGNSAITQLDGGAGKDFFQFGQLFGSSRISPFRVAVGDEFATVATTMGLLSRGVRYSTVAQGGDGDDTMIVYANQAPLALFGEDGDDSFTVRAFAIQKPLGIAQINSPVSIDGGQGFEKLDIITTEADESIVVARDNVAGAGLNVTYKNVTRLEVDAMQGDDHFYVLSTAAETATLLIGGVGSDTIDVGGDVVTPIIAKSVEGQSGIINHFVVSGDPTYNGIQAQGISLNVATQQAGPVVVTESGGDTMVVEDNTDPKTNFDTYTLRMADLPGGQSTGLVSLAYITVSAAMAPYRDAIRGGRSVQVSTDGVNYSDSLVVAFDSQAQSNSPLSWTRGVTIYVRAVGDVVDEGDQTVVISHSLFSNNPILNRANIANVEVKVVDNDRPGLIVKQTGTTMVVQEGGIVDSYTVSLTKPPAVGETVTVQLTTDPSQLTLSTNSIVFTSANWNATVLVKVTATNNAVVENPALVNISHSISSDKPAGIYAGITQTTQVEVDVRDNDTSGVLVTQSNDATLVASGLADTYTLQLNRTPTAPVVIALLTDGKTVVSADPFGQLPGRFAFLGGIPTVTFDATNWKIPFTVRVTAALNVQGASQQILYPAQPHTTTLIDGPLTIEGGDLPDKDRSVKIALILPTELNTALPTPNIVVDENKKTDTLNVFNDGSVVNDIGALNLGSIPDGLAAQYEVSTVEAAAHVKEFGNITGLGMADKQALDFGLGGVPDVRNFHGGIVFHDVEIADTMLGTGKDTFTVETTLPDMITVVQGGGGDDTLIANDGGGANSPLILLGDTTQDGRFYDSTTFLPNGHARAFFKAGNDTLDASKATQSVTLYGGGGNDLIRGGSAGDWIAGGSGNDILNGNGGNDAIQGDDGFNLNLTQRLSLSTQILTVATDFAAADYLITRDNLVGGVDKVNGGGGIDIIFGDHGVITQVANTNRILTTGKVTSLLAVRTDGGADVLSGGAENDIILGGAAGDAITDTEGNNVLIGDNALITFNSLNEMTVVQSTDPAVAGDDLIVGGVGDELIIGGSGNDTVNSGDGANFVIGDGGKFTFSVGKVNKAEASPVSIGGIDTITTGVGDDVILGGFGNDVIDSGAGKNIVLGDSGYVSLAAGGVLLEIKTTGGSFGGNDKITTGIDADVVAGGVGDDTVNAGEGANIVFGDGTWLTYLGGQLLTIQTIDPTLGGKDTIVTGAGADVVFGGFSSDKIDAGNGLNVVWGDNGRFTLNGPLPGKIETTDASFGASDTIVTGSGDDVIIGGTGGDTIGGGAGNNVVFGDNGYVLYNATGQIAEIKSTDAGSGGDDSIVTGAALDVVIGGFGSDTIKSGDGLGIVFGDDGWVTFAGGSLSVAQTINPTIGGADKITGGRNVDVIFGGISGDTITAGDGDNVVFGDNGRVTFAAGLVSIIASSPISVAETIDTRYGGTDSISTGIGDDLVFGGQAGDSIRAGSGNDIVFGDNGKALYSTTGVVVQVVSTDTIFGGDDTLAGDAGDDVLVGGSGSDVISGAVGRDLIMGDNAMIDRQTTIGDKTNPRFRVLTDAQIYDTAEGTAGKVMVKPDWQANPDGSPAWADFRITLLEMNVDAFTFGNDYIAGGAQDDTIFGQLGNDVIQGDGTTDITQTGGKRVSASRDGTNTLLLNPSFDASTNGNDYIEGNGGNDVIFGNQGQDDIIGGSSDLFSLTTAGLRADGADIIFGGSGIAVARDALGNVTDDGHAADSDMILGDNGNIYRIVNSDGKSVTFNYDSYSPTVRIVVRGAEMLDYTPGGSDFNKDRTLSDRGAADEIHGESGDDFIFGMVGNDVLFGDAQNDSIVAGYGADWVSGGTGDDGILGDDGLIFASRNSTEFGEPLYNIKPIAADQINLATKDDQGILIGLLNVEKALKYTADLTPDNLDPAAIQNPNFRPLNANDIIFGGLGNDSIHAGAGDDAVSGAEAQKFSYIANYSPLGTLLNPFSPLTESDFDKPFNPGNPLGYSIRSTKFALYDANVDVNDGLREIFLTAAGGLAKSNTGLPWFLNFNASEGPKDDKWTVGTSYDALPTDGDDRIFADLGNDWAVGGTGRDAIYGGWGDDLLNADDDLSTNGSLNNKADTNPSYEDLVYGGAGRDVLIGNTAGDRLVDWDGSFNTYLLPFSKAGLPTVVRTATDSIQTFLLDLSESQGADLTLAAQHGTDPARNGEPLGELGMVTDKDIAWPSQQGVARDGQPQNLQTEPDVKDTAGTLPIWQTASAPATGTEVGAITTGDLIPIVDEARLLWTKALGSDDPRLSILNGITIQVGNLPDNRLGVTMADTILIDRDAAGWGWFVDSTPDDNTEFSQLLSNGSFGATMGTVAAGRMDLLSTVLHEMGNAMGFPETVEQGVAGMFLQTGIRTLPLPANRTEDEEAESAPTIDWTGHAAGPDLLDQGPSWLSDFLNNAGQDGKNRNPNAAIRLRVPG